MAKRETLLEKLDKAMRQRQFEKHSKDAYNWLKKEASTLYGSRTRARIMKEQRQAGRTLRGNPKHIHIGDMLFYDYSDPKHKKTLPYYDKYPLIIVLNAGKDRFWGVNLHYVPPRYRARIFDQLMLITNNDRFDETTKMRMTYDMIKSMSKIKILKACFREYLTERVKSRVSKIQPQYWEIAMFLPLQSFEKSTASKIWSDTIQKSL